MSILQFPRVYFNGQIAWDPVTTNNYTPSSAAAAYDENDCESVLNRQPVTASDVTGFRSAAIDGVNNGNGNWNPDGTYRSPFFETTISGVDGGSGHTTDDAMFGAPVSFTGMLVDAEPYGAYSSQLFFDDISFGIRGGCRIYGKRAVHFTDRFINFGANPLNGFIAGGAAVVWQTCFPKDTHLQIDAFDSATLAAMADSMASDDVLGVMVRFVTYRTIYYDVADPLNNAAALTAARDKLVAELNSGGFQPNPARSKLVGTVGLWSKDDCLSEASERALAATGAPFPVSSASGAPRTACGTAFAQVHEQALSIDMSNCIPWSADDASSKVDLGPLTIVATDPDDASQTTTVGVINSAAYSQTAYENSAGIVDVPLDPGMAATIADFDISIVTAQNVAIVQEDPYRVLPLDPNFYTDAGASASTRARLYVRGKPAGAGENVVISPMSAASSVHATLQTDAKGWVSFSLPNTTGSVTGYVFQAQPDPSKQPTLPVGNAFNPMTWTYMYHRVLPADDDIAAMDPTWANVHGHVLANWEAMAPCMDNWLRLGDEEQVKAYAPLIKKLTAKESFEDFRYMPVTRDLTQGMRTLLYRFLDGETAEATAELSVAAADYSVTAGLEPVDQVAPPTEMDRLSRSHRSPD